MKLTKRPAKPADEKNKNNTQFYIPVLWEQQQGLSVCCVFVAMNASTHWSFAWLAKPLVSWNEKARMCFFFCEIFKRAPGWKWNEKWRVVRMCQDGLLTVTARLGERGTVMATTTQKPDTFQCLHHSGKKSFKHLKRSSWQCFICIFTMRTSTGVTDQILLTHSRRSVRSTYLWRPGNWRRGRVPPEGRKWALGYSPLKVLGIIKRWRTRLWVWWRYRLCFFQRLAQKCTSSVTFMPSLFSQINVCVHYELFIGM